jgi:hypothetical protein
MKRIVILGAGESGAGAAVLAKVKGFETFVSDMSAIKDKYKELLDSHHIDWEEGRHTEELILNADEVIKSPGIPNDAPLILKLKAQGTPVISEIEFAGRYTNAKMICITGSNGKTTTTSLIYHIFKSAGMNVGLAGNIGKSLALQVAEDHHDYYIIIHKELLIPILCGVFLVENLSVILQRAYYKAGKRKGVKQRLFKRTPIHDHFRTSMSLIEPGCTVKFTKPDQLFHESKITVRFWIVTIVLAAITIITLKIR